MRIYLAGPLYTPGERWYLEQVADQLKRAGHSVFVPHLDIGLSTGQTAEPGFYFRGDIGGLNTADAVAAVLNGTDVDSGTAFEMGYAYARGKPVLGLYDDTRHTQCVSHMNLMITNSAELAPSVDALLELLARR